ncbi:MAG: putative bifunctional diguanylate cyclase/phosphodiesterase [Geminicoccaceae bacterium]
MLRTRTAIFVLFAAALVAASYLVSLSARELGHLRLTIAEIDREVDRARQFRDLIDKMNQSILSFTAVALDLSAEERLAFLQETEAYFAEFRSSVARVEKSTADFLSPDQRRALDEALVAVIHSWDEIRDQFDTGMEEAAKAYHFLQITDEIRVARSILVLMEEAATRSGNSATRQAFERIEQSAGLLIKFALVVGATSLCALLGMGWFALATRRANRALQETLDELKRRDKALMVQNERFDAALGNMSQGLCMFDDQERLIVANKRFSEIFRLPERLTKSGTTFSDFERFEDQMLADCSASQGDGYVSALCGLMIAGKPGTTTNELSDGRTVEIWFRPMQGGGWVTTFEDITERRRTEAQIAYMARHDALTGLGNRTLFRDEMMRALVRAGRGEKVGVLCLDLDRFKNVNDTLGHPVGDALLEAVADRLRSCVREVDTVARLGGDEFAIIVHEASHLEGVITLAERIIASISAPYEIRDQQLNIGTSIGIAIAPRDGKDPDRILKAADLALYRAKEDGKGRVRLFEAEMDQRLQTRRTLEMQLRRAHSEGEFLLHYQPLVDANDGRISAFEALLRWNSRERGMVPPAEFIPLAEEVGLIVPLSEWVLRTACAEAANWPGSIKVAINLSPVHFYHGDLVKSVATALRESGLAPERLELEITEGVLLEDTNATIVTLTALKRLGIRIAMDDFGTGYCSLSYLQKFPFDKIKIDQSFVRDLGDNPEALAIIRAVSGLANSLGIATTAEGVETDEQLRQIRAEGCTEAQGYLFSKPAPADEVPSVLAALDQSDQSAA